MRAQTAHGRSIRTLLAVALAAVLLPLAQMAATTPVAAAAAPSTAAAAPSGPGSITLHVQSARSVNAGTGFVHKGDPVQKYRWLVNVDDTGDPGTSAHPGIEKCLPSTRPGRQLRPGLRRLVRVALDPQHLRLRADRRPG